MKRIALTAVITWVAATAGAQEFARGTGGEIEATTKSHEAPFSGSIGIDLLNGGRNGYMATLGGTLLQDRLWFFASTNRTERTSSYHAIPELSAVARVEATAAKTGFHLGSRQTLDATFSQQDVAPGTQSPLAIPSTFLSLRYTGIVTPNTFFTMSVSTSKSKSPN